MQSKNFNLAAFTKYSLGCIDLSETEEAESTTPATAIVNLALAEKRLMPLKSKLTTVEDWLRGLPSCFDVEFRGYEQTVLLRHFGLTEEEAEKVALEDDFFYRITAKVLLHESEKELNQQKLKAELFDN